MFSSFYRHPSKWLVIQSAIIGFTVPFALYSNPFVRRTYQVEHKQSMTVYGVTMIFSAAFVILTGYLSDRLGHQNNPRILLLISLVSIAATLIGLIAHLSSRVRSIYETTKVDLYETGDETSQISFSVDRKGIRDSGGEDSSKVIFIFVFMSKWVLLYCGA